MAPVSRSWKSRLEELVNSLRIGYTVLIVHLPYNIEELFNELVFSLGNVRNSEFTHALHTYFA